MDILQIDLVRILYVCSQPDPQIFGFSKGMFDIEHTASPIEAFQRLYKTQYQIIIVEIALFGDELQKAISEIKRRFPLMIVVALEDARLSNIEILNMGADSILPYTITGDAWNYMIRSQLKQQRQKIALNNRNNKLNIVSQLSHQLYFSDSPRHLIQHTINSLCVSLHLYGVAIVLDADEHKQLYAGNHQSPQMYETIIHLESYHPFQRTMDLGICQVYDNIQNDPFYHTIPTLSDVTSAIIVPLRYKDTLLGVMGVFNHAPQRFSNDDLIIYEIFASHLTTALTQARNQSIQQNDFEFNQRLLQAWHKFSVAYDLDELADILLESCQNFSGMANALVWFYGSPDTNQNLVVRATNPQIIEVFHELEEERVVSGLLKEVDDRYYIPLRRHRDPGRYVLPLLDRLGQNEYMLFGIVKANTFGGGLILASMPNKNFRIDQVNLIQGICQIVAQKYEHIILLNETNNKSARLEALLRNVGEGIFFVDPANRVIFCNTQFTELTGINRSEILDQDYHVLVDLLAHKTDTPSPLSDAILRAIAQLNQGASQEESYSIVELSINKQAMYLEFSSLTTQEGNVGWGGFIRQRQGPSAMSMDNALNGLVLQQLRPMFQQTKQQARELVKLGARLNPTQASQWLKRLRDLDQQVYQLSQVWTDFSEMIRHPLADDEARGVEIHTIIQELLTYEPSVASKLQPLSLEQAQRFLISRSEVSPAIQNILLFAINQTNPQTSLKLSWGAEDNQIVLLLENFQSPINLSTLQQIFQGAYEEVAPLLAQETNLFSLYLSASVVRQYYGSITIEKDASGYVHLVIMLPGVPLNGKNAHLTSSTSDTSLSGSKYQVPSRPLRTVMFVEGGSSIGTSLYQGLQKSNIEILTYRGVQQVIEDLKLMRPDLIIMDTRQATDDITLYVERIRRASASPIVLFADKASHIERVRGLKSGAEEFITGDMPMDEMLTRINIISNRQTISDRVREPLELRHLKIDFAQRQVFLKGKLIIVTRTEYNLLRILANNMGHVITHQELLKEVWGVEYAGERQYLWVNLSRLRKKLEPDQNGPRYIHNESSIGYIFMEVLPEEES